MVSAADRRTRPVRMSVWLEAGAPRGRRADAPSGLDRDRITRAAVRLLDAEGLARFSMRRLAAELDVTAMSLYWYVETKDDLLELALDMVFGELSLPDPASGEDWRVQLRGLAADYRALLVRHPWVSPLMGTFLNIGPYAIAFSVCVRRVVRNTGLPADRQTGALAAVFQFVYGFGTIEGHFIQRCAGAGTTQDEYYHRAMSTIGRQPGLMEVLEPADLAGGRDGATVEEMRDRDFEVALDLLVAGIEAMA